MIGLQQSYQEKTRDIMSVNPLIYKTISQFVRFVNEGDKIKKNSMGILGGLFGNKESRNDEERPKLPWIPLTSLEQLDEIETSSNVKPQVIFKHSTTCGISRMVLNMFTSSYGLGPNQMNLYFLDLHAHRDVSNKVAEKFQVMHQSPQLLIVKSGVVVAHDSHGAISDINLEQYV